MAENMRIGGRYNWRGQHERLVYIGRNWSGNGYWHQFEKVDEPGIVWCEVVDSDLWRFEATAPAASEPLSVSGQGFVRATPEDYKSFEMDKKTGVARHG